MVGYLLKTTVVLTLALLAAAAARRRSGRAPAFHPVLRPRRTAPSPRSLARSVRLADVPRSRRDAAAARALGRGRDIAARARSPHRGRGRFVEREATARSESDGGRPDRSRDRSIGARSAARRREPIPAAPSRPQRRPTDRPGHAATAGRTARTLEASGSVRLVTVLWPVGLARPALPARRRPGRGRQADRGGNAARRPGLARPPRALPRARLAPAPGPPEEPSRGHWCP
ncbi:MAG: hypothetical protein M0C28_45020 [Candidatus Moduliflexus flocculans]|nr:hypothetical protein [Candidatus Moduliflexus flocculans]